MAKKIVWTLRSIQDRIQIYQYWMERNQSDACSKKLESLFILTASLLSKYPEIGSATNLPSVRVKVIKNFKMFYQVQENQIVILRTWDTHQNPKALKLS